MMVFSCLILGLSGSVAPTIFNSVVDMACTETRYGVCLLLDHDKIRLDPIP